MEARVQMKKSCHHDMTLGKHKIKKKNELKLYHVGTTLM